MKTLIFLASLIPAANAGIAEKYMRDVMTETTARSFEKDPTSGQFRCEPGFTGSDCSQLKCPYSMSFATSNVVKDWLYTPSYARQAPWKDGEINGDVVTGKQSQTTKDTTFANQHVYRECGGRGLCDRSTGECRCFASFTGEGCRRTTCPNDCSGHGQCSTDANAFFYVGQTPKVPYGNNIPAYSKSAGAPTWGIHWPWLKYQQCNCDAGYEGDDCSLRRCPKGDDPETECVNDLGNDKQTLVCDFQKAAVSTTAYTDLQKTKCEALVGDYATLDLAKTACTGLGAACGAVYDAGCDASGNFVLCKPGTDVVSATADCIFTPSTTTTFDGALAESAYFQLRFTDQFGGEYDTRPILVDVSKSGTDRTMTDEQNANSIQDALEALPNFAIPEVEVDFTVKDGDANKETTIDIVFTDGHNTGKQPMLVAKSMSQCGSGSQPLFKVLNTQVGDFTCTVARVEPGGATYKESATCANRGICDQSTGRCNCFDGYFGLACDHVNTYI